MNAKWIELYSQESDLTCPLGNDLPTYREALLAGKSGVSLFPVRNMGDQPAGVCDFDQTKNIKSAKKFEWARGLEALPFIVPMKQCRCRLELGLHRFHLELVFILALPNMEMLRLKLKFASFSITTMRMLSIGLIITTPEPLPITRQVKLQSTLV